MRQGWCVQRTEPSQRQGLRSSPWRKSDDGPCQLSPPDLTSLQERKTSPCHSPTFKKLSLSTKTGQKAKAAAEKNKSYSSR